MELLLRRRGHPDPNDCFVVIKDGREIGMITHRIEGPAPYWSWSQTVYLPDPHDPAKTGGWCLKREQAMAAFRSALEAVLAGPHSVTPEPAVWRPGRVASWEATARLEEEKRRKRGDSDL